MTNTILYIFLSCYILRINKMYTKCSRRVPAWYAVVRSVTESLRRWQKIRSPHIASRDYARHALFSWGFGRLVTFTFDLLHWKSVLGKRWHQFRLFYVQNRLRVRSSCGPDGRADKQDANATSADDTQHKYSDTKQMLKLQNSVNQMLKHKRSVAFTIYAIKSLD